MTYAVRAASCSRVEAATVRARSGGGFITRIAVTGASGKAGRAAVRDLVEHGHDVIAIDLLPSSDPGVRILQADLTDYGQAIDALDGVESVVHLANIPADRLRPPVETFNANVTMNFNVFYAATRLELQRVVWASSETTLGLPFDAPPRYLPIDEDHYPYPSTTYALSKVASETIAAHIAGWSAIPFVALRFSNILDVTDYAGFPEHFDDPALRKWNLWSYIDLRDAAAACRLALEASVEGAESFVIAAPDTVMTTPTAGLVSRFFPGVEVRREPSEFGSLMSGERARRLLGFEPRHSWRAGTLGQH
jgi:nucleoside-diphosphate-sugar epimerase